MCTTCGCSGDAIPRIGEIDGERTRERTPSAGGAPDHAHHPEAHDHRDPHGPEDVHHHHHHHDDPASVRTHAEHDVGIEHTRTLRLEQDVLEKNNRAAARNRGWFEGREILACNLMSSPGSGKTTLLERSIRDLGAELVIAVIEGDQETARDAERIRATGSRVVQINTGTGCHLDAEMIARGVRQLDPPVGSVVMIENVGNLVCPALFDLGEHTRVVVMSVTEGEDKPLKYPHMFRASDVMILNKIDLLPYVQFDVSRCLASARRVNPRLQIFQVSATRGDGLDAWYGWLRTHAPRPILDGHM